jgi:acetyl-CoA carboxylase carboxyltransferase component
MSWKKEVDEIHQRRSLAKDQGGDEAVQKQHDKGRLTIRERISAVVDQNSFQEQGMGAGAADIAEDGSLKEFSPANYVLGMGQINGRNAVVGGEDFTLKGGSPNPAGLRKSVFAEDMALLYKVPLVRLLEGGGGSVAGNDNKGSRPMGAPVNARPRFLSIAQVMGEVPVASAALGPVAGFPAARLVASHFAVMIEETSQVLIGGPQLVKRALGEDLTKEELGGTEVHLKNGVAHSAAKTEEEAFDLIRQFLSYMPQNVWDLPPRGETNDPATRADEELLDIVPRDRRKPFAMRKVIKHIVDNDSFFELGRKYGPGQITGLARLNGYPVGILGNDCRYYAGAMTADGAQKVIRFFDLCNTFHLPIVSLVDEPGFMIGSESEKAGTIRYGTAAVAAAMQSVTPWASVIVRKAYGVAAAAHFGPDGLVLSWPSAESGALPLEGGVAVAFGRQIAASDDPEAKRDELEKTLAARLSPFPRAENFSVHELIDPRETRGMLAQWVKWSLPRLEQLKGPYKITMRP